jgi:hypothetical protein
MVNLPASELQCVVVAHLARDDPPEADGTGGSRLGLGLLR